eukprot:71743_1
MFSDLLQRTARQFEGFLKLIFGEGPSSDTRKQYEELPEEINLSKTERSFGHFDLDRLLRSSHQTREKGFVDGRVHWANERTFLKWIQLCMYICFFGLAFVMFSTDKITGAVLLG